MAAENGAPGLAFCTAVVLEMVEFLFVLLSYGHLSISECDDIVSKFKSYLVNLVHCCASKLSDFQLEH